MPTQFRPGDFRGNLLVGSSGTLDLVWSRADERIIPFFVRWKKPPADPVREAIELARIQSDIRFRDGIPLHYVRAQPIGTTKARGVLIYRRIYGQGAGATGWLRAFWRPTRYSAEWFRAEIDEAGNPAWDADGYPAGVLSTADPADPFAYPMAQMHRVQGDRVAVPFDLPKHPYTYGAIENARGRVNQESITIDGLVQAPETVLMDSSLETRNLVIDNQNRYRGVMLFTVLPKPFRSQKALGPSTPGNPLAVWATKNTTPYQTTTTIAQIPFYQA